MTPAPRDHGGGLDAAVARWGGRREEWLDLSTGINPVPYPLPAIPAEAWTRLPDREAFAALEAAARAFWRVPEGAEVIAAPGLSALIARLPGALGWDRVAIPGPTYNEYAAAFAAAGVAAGVATGVATGADADAPLVAVHPNNPDGRRWSAAELGGRPAAVIDESFCEVTPEASHVALAAEPGRIVLKGLGKFWGLAGVRLGVAILAPGPVATRMREALGPWAVSGPALAIGTAALSDPAWAEAARARLARDSARLDALMIARGARVAGGTTLFRLYETGDASAWAERLARVRVLARVFPYSRGWVRLGLPGPDGWARLESHW